MKPRSFHILPFGKEAEEPGDVFHDLARILPGELSASALLEQLSRSIQEGTIHGAILWRQGRLNRPTGVPWSLHRLCPVSVALQHQARIADFSPISNGRCVRFSRLFRAAALDG